MDGDTFNGAKYRALFYIQSFFRSPDEWVTLQWHGETYQNTLGALRNNGVLAAASQSFWLQLQVIFLGCAMLGIAAIVVVMRYFQRKGNQQTQDRFIRGMQQASPEVLAQQLKQRGDASTFRLDKRAIFKADFEVQHVLLDGTTGSGKSVVIRKLLAWIRQRGDKAIVYDKGCTFVSKFYDPTTDVLLNPFDERCAAWDVWCDGDSATDFDNMAAALIPMHGEGDPFWVQSARTIFASTAYKMLNDDDRSTHKLLALMLTSELESLSEYLKNTESASLVSDKIQKTAISIKSVLAAYIKSLRFLEGLEINGEDEHKKPPHRRYSIRDWVQNDDQRGFLFLSSHAQQHASLRPLLSMWLAIASTAILGLKENPKRRIWVIMDEAPSLHKLPELAETIAEVRKFGGCYVIGVQSYAQLRKVYGDQAAKEMFDLLNTRLFFRAPSYAMAKLASEELGEQEIDISREQYSYGANSIRDGISLGHQTMTKPVVTASEIMQLNDLQCWLRTPGDYPIVRLNVHFDAIDANHPPFLPRNYQPSKDMVAIDSLLAWCQVGAPSTLDSDTKHALMHRYHNDYDNEDERTIEQQRLHKALQSPLSTSVSAAKPSSSSSKPTSTHHDATGQVNQASTTDKGNNNNDDDTPSLDKTIARPTHSPSLSPESDTTAEPSTVDTNNKQTTAVLPEKHTTTDTMLREEGWILGMDERDIDE
jgi:type IV conjugative transfer system coupling protein TraD